MKTMTTSSRGFSTGTGRRELRPLRFGLGIALLIAWATTTPRPARADIPPPDACTAPGQPCNNAGPSHDQAGTCTESTCTKTVPSADGGTMQMMYACNLCKVSGTGGTGGAGGAKDGGTEPHKDSDFCSAAGPVAGGLTGGGALTLAAALGLLHARRRRRP